MTAVRVAPIQCGQRLSVRGEPVEAVSILNLAGPANGIRVIHAANDNNRYRMVQWPDGSIYRIKREIA